VNGLAAAAVTASAAVAVTMLAAASVYGLAPLPWGISLLLAAEVTAFAACAIPAAVRHTSRED
jgi:hypothetical protein